jgi:hypothetical protein
MRRPALHLMSMVQALALQTPEFVASLLADFSLGNQKRHG